MCVRLRSFHAILLEAKPSKHPAPSEGVTTRPLQPFESSEKEPMLTEPPRVAEAVGEGS